jgi:hypothetical protein
MSSVVLMDEFALYTFSCIEALFIALIAYSADDVTAGGETEKGRTVNFISPCR